ncbi:MAG: Ycf48-like protein [Ignavibacteria bacterium]|nr:Ycf48-like protein [Ignavibacteria bacterium]
MKSLYLTLAFILVFIFTENIISQESNEENESSESILDRQNYYAERRAGGPGKKVPTGAREKAVKQMFAMQEDRNLPGSPTSGLSWQSVNPTGMFYALTNDNYISGRTNSIAFHPTNENIIYIAAAQGGVWKTTDGGINWFQLTDNLGSLASGDIEIDPLNPDILYYGTGELNYSGDSQYGDGIYKTTNGGISWTKIATTADVGSYIAEIVIDHTNTNNVYCTGNLGVFKSTNAGLNWTNFLVLNSTSLIIHPVNPQILYAASGNVTSQIYKTTNGGIIWTLLTNGLNTSAGRRTQLAISKDNPEYIYASIASSSGSLLGLYRTTNGGDNWTLQNSSTNYMSSQGWYDNAVTVIAGNPEGVVVGGLDVYVSTNGGVTLTKKSAWSTSNPLSFSHADIHYLTYRDNVLFCCSDGGVYKSTNNADTWSDLNEKISTLQYKSADYDPSDLNKLYGGCQDNNKQTSTNNGVVWIQRSTGDGGYTIVDPENTNYVYGQYVNGSIQRSTNYGVSFTNITPSGSSGGLFYNPYEMAPGDPNTVVFGRANVWKTANIKTATTSSGWTQIAATSVISGSISAIGISKINTDKIYLGTSNGKIFVTSNNGTNWTTQTGYPYVSDLWVDHANDDVCYATFTGFTADKHVYKTTNGGMNWFSITGNLPNIPVNSIAVRHLTPKMIFAGTDLGIYKSTDEGSTWVSFNSGLPNIEINDLKYKEGPKVLLAATYGRGCYKFDVSGLVSINEENSHITDYKLYQNFPNPFNPSTTIKFEIPEKGFVTLKIYDLLGNEIESAFGRLLTAGSYEFNFYAERYSSGIYFYKLITDKSVYSKSMLLIK